MKFRFSDLLLVAAVAGVNGQNETDAPVTTAPAPVLIMVPSDTPAPVPLSPVMMTTPAPVVSPTTSAPVTPAPSPADASAEPITNAPSTSMPVTTIPTSSSPTAFSLIDYFEDPVQKWTIQLPDTNIVFGSKLGKGNAVSASPDGASVYVTLSDGRLEVLSAFDGGVRFSYKPIPTAAGWSVMCKSGVSFSEMGGQQFAIYAVVDVPPPGLVDYQS
jgi:hypothetical protein